jgi:catalase
VAILAVDGFDASAVEAALREGGAAPKIVSTRLGTIRDAEGRERLVDFSFLTTASVLFDAVYVASGELAQNAEAIAFVSEAFRHRKAIGAAGNAVEVLRACGGALADTDGDLPGVIAARDPARVVEPFVEAIARHRHWDRPV